MNEPGVNNQTEKPASGSIVWSEEMENVDTMTRTATGALKRKPKQTPYDRKAAKKIPENFNTIINDKEGKPRNVVLIPTHNQFDLLTDKSQEIKMNVEAASVPKKTRIPPITVFNQPAETVKKGLIENEIKNFSIKHLRHGIHVYCSTTDDFKKVRQLLASNQHQFYSHELAEEKLYKVVLRGLHKMPETELLNELKLEKLNPTSIRTINPRNSASRDDVLYVVSFPKGSLKLKDLNEHKVICHTRVTWESYRHRGGLVQCARCQRPGHGVKYCNMPPRCAFCGGEHESKDCPPTKQAVEAAQASSAVNVEVQTPAKCCNCNTVGHFATDSSCPKRIQYIKSRQQRSRDVNQRQSYVQPQTIVPNVHLRRPGGPSYAQVVSEPGPSLGPSGTNRPSDFSNHSGYTHPPNITRPSGNYNNDPFTVEEITALTFEIIGSLQNVQYMPRHEAMMTIISLAMKHLYKNDK